ncbi:P-loop NTPase fold protein [Crocosphaera sp. XPORK-15E]|uniref:P-loop NTPase fold protein n=1 Tax=Crocosphaera sp. XPORK-15E TaxID=3110247 RepID=UPI002B20075E|nr:P-loop NTPase fold protein [Crocosphaera sp. XPORK-15E]MEA5534047.1 P-loop NTPase fold protein [Crocosphaera sp. XPORK-15E]
MATNNLLEAFRITYQNLQLLPLITPEDLAKFRVEYGTRVRAELEQVVEDCTDINNKVIFTGHRGCGKSTLLADFSRRIRDRYFVTFFSISDMIEMSDVNHINILFAIAVQMMDQAEKENIKIKESIKEKFYQWFATKTRTNIEEKKREGGPEFNLFGWIKLQLKTNSTIRNEIKQEFQRNISELIDQVDLIATVIRDKTEQEILVIIDDLDKLDLGVVREIFSDHIKVLMRPKFRIIYTVPMAAMRDKNLRTIMQDESNNQVKLMPVSKFFGKGENRNPDAEPNQKLVEVFKQIIGKRIASDLIEPDILTEIILKSGGVLREAIRIMNQCCSECLLLIRMEPHQKNIKIDRSIFEQAIRELRNDLARPLSNTDYQILTTIYNKFNPDISNDNDQDKFLELLHNVYILEYINDDLWYDVHPIVIDLLQRRGLLLES